MAHQDSAQNKKNPLWYAYAPLSGAVYAPGHTEEELAQSLEENCHVPEGQEPSACEPEYQLTPSGKKKLRLMNEWGIDFPLWASDSPLSVENFPQLPQSTIDQLRRWAHLYNSQDPEARDCPLLHLHDSLDQVPEKFQPFVEEYTHLRESIRRSLTEYLGDEYEILVID